MTRLDNYIPLIKAQNGKWNEIPAEYYSKYNVKRGLRNADGTGVLAGLTAVGEVHGYAIREEKKTPIDGILRYRGINIEDIVAGAEADGRFGFNETAFLLLFGFLPSLEQLDGFSSIIAEFQNLPPGFTEDMILKAPSPNIMNKMARCVLASYSYDENTEELSVSNMLRQGLILISRMPVFAAYAYQAKQHYYDGKSLFIHPPAEGVCAAENFLRMLRPDGKCTKLEAQVLDLALMLHAEHGAGNNSSFVTRVVSSSMSDTYSAIAAAIGSLKGPKHGGANESALVMMRELKERVRDWEDEDEVYSYLQKIIRKKAGDGSGLIYGIGHAVYTLSDPRALLLKKKTLALCAQYPAFTAVFRLYDMVERLAPKALSEAKGIDMAVSANVDFYSGLIYEMMNIPRDMFTPIFAVSRVVGWCAHRIEEVATGGKIIRPAYKSIVDKTDYIPLKERT